MKQKTLMVDEPVWLWLKEHQGVGSISDLIQTLINESTYYHDCKNRILRRMKKDRNYKKNTD